MISEMGDSDDFSAKFAQRVKLDGEKKTEYQTE